jgi:hypothetical protein
VIPAGYVVNIYGAFTPVSNLSVGGTLNIVKGSTLTVTSSLVLNIGYAKIGNAAVGAVNVLEGGKLVADALASIKFAGTDANSAGGLGTVQPLDLDALVAADGTVLGSATVTPAAPNAKLVFNTDSIFAPSTALDVSTDADDLKALANARFIVAGSGLTNAVVAVQNLTVRKGTIVVATGALAPTGTTTVNGSLTANSTASITGALVVNGTLSAANAGIDLTGLSSASGTGSLTLGTGDFGLQAAQLLNIAEVTSAATTITGSLTVQQDKALTLTGGNAAPTGTVIANGILTVRTKLTLVDQLSIGNYGALVLQTGGIVLLGDGTSGDSKIVAATYNITPESGDDTGTLTAGASSTAVVFIANEIRGYNNVEQVLADLTTDPASAATLAFGAADSELNITYDTVLSGVVIDIATKGIINVAANQKLTLKLGTGSNHIASGGIFTVVVGSGTPGGVVKANAFTPKDSSGAFANIAVLGAAKVEKQAAASVSTNGDLGAGATPGTSDPADGVITDTNPVVIAINDTFAVNASNIIEVTDV